MSILKNAVESIQIGVEDYGNSDSRRSRAAVRNITAGMLLLFKEKLRQLSPSDSDEVLIKRDILPIISVNKTICFKGTGKKTVDVYQIKERFKSLGIKVDWKIFDEINDLRNYIEHYFTEKSPSVINEILSKCFILIRDFCVDYLDEDPSFLFEQECWNIFLGIDEVYQKEKELCTKSMSQIDWTFKVIENGVDSIRCPKCLSDLVMSAGQKKYIAGQEMLLICKKCQNEFDFEDVIEECISDALSAENYLAIAEGGEYPSEECPECLKETYVYDEGVCVGCGYGHIKKKCAVCNNDLSIEEAYESDLCFYHLHQVEEDY